LIGRRFGPSHRDFDSFVRERPGAAEKDPNEQTDNEQKADANGEGRMFADLRSGSVLGHERAGSLVDLRARVFVEWHGFQLVRAGAIKSGLPFEFRR
jgi:hypothetical protein